MSQPPRGVSGPGAKVGRIGFWNQGGTAMFAPKVAEPQTKATASSTSNLAQQRSTLVARRPAVQEALLLQRTIGNQAPLRLPAQRASNLIGNEPGGGDEQEAAPENMTKSAAASQSVQQVPELEHGRKTAPRLQANLRIN